VPDLAKPSDCSRSAASDQFMRERSPPKRLSSDLGFDTRFQAGSKIAIAMFEVQFDESIYGGLKDKVVIITGIRQTTP